MDVPVLIIGAGPSGSTAALHLGHLGIKCLVVSKHKSTANTPRAHIFNQRAREVLRDAGLDQALNGIAVPAEEMQHTSWTNTLGGEEYGRLWAWGNKPSQIGDYITASPCVMSDIPQNRLEPLLVQEATKAGAEIRFNTEFVRFTQSPTGVETILQNRETGAEYTVTSQYLVGADGGRSPVLEALGIPVTGRQINTAFNVHIKADLSKYIKNRPGSLNWVLNTDAPDWSAVGNFRMVRPWDEFVVSMHPATKDPTTFEPTNESILARLHSMIGDDKVPIEILSCFSWSINDMVADKWQAGRVLCIGDATHRHPPINGLGSNTCISDAFNLAWKLAYVLKGWASPSLLETLDFERKPVGDAIVRRANAGMEAHRMLWGVLGLDPQSRKHATDLLQSATPAGAVMRRRLREAIEATEDEVQALGIQMNQAYLGSTATLAEPGDSPPDFTGLNRLREVMTTTYPGYHLPHVWLAAHGCSPKVSTLDLSGHGAFTIFTGIGGEAWVEAARVISRGDSGVQVTAYTVGFRRDYIDCYRDWERVRGVGESGVVLVRPDHFVAWRCHEMSGHPLEKLRSVLRSVLGKL